MKKLAESIIKELTDIANAMDDQGYASLADAIDSNCKRIVVLAQTADMDEFINEVVERTEETGGDEEQLVEDAQKTKEQQEQISNEANMTEDEALQMMRQVK